MRKTLLTKAAFTLLAAFFGLTEANAQTIVSDVSATHVGPTYATIGWEGTATALRYRVVAENQISTYDFDNSQLGSWSTFSGWGDTSTTNTSNYTNGGQWYGGKFVWAIFASSANNYFSYVPAKGQGHRKSADMVVSGSFCHNSNDNTFSNHAIEPKNFLVSPQITFGGTISFWAKGMDESASDENFSVVVFEGTTAPTRNSSYTTVLADQTASPDWTQYVVDLGNYSGQGYVAILHHDCYDEDLLCVDDIVITQPTAGWTNLTPSGSTYTFPEEALDPETNYQVEVQIGGKWYGTHFTTTSYNPVPAEVNANPVGQFTATPNWFGLTENYILEYKRDAKDGPQYWFDDFEDGFNEGWTTQLGSGATTPNTTFNNGWAAVDNTNLTAHKFAAHSGSRVAKSVSWQGSAYNANNYLITPKVMLGKKVKFWVRSNPGYPDDYEVLLATEGNAISNFTVNLTGGLVTVEAVREWRRVSYNIPDEYLDTEGYIAIHHQKRDGNYIVIDDFGIFGDDVPGSDDWTAIPTTASSVALGSGSYDEGDPLMPLVPNTTYEYRVSSILGDETVTTDIFTFKTEKLTSLELVDNGSNSDRIRTLGGASGIDVTLKDRKIVGGKWNTLCLPFTLTSRMLAQSPLAGADIRALTGASFSKNAETGDKTLTLTFSKANSIEFGVPYIVKPSTTITEPTFDDVTIREALELVKYKKDLGNNMSITFRGTYDKISDFTKVPGVSSLNSVLFMNADNQLVYPASGSYLKAQRALFVLSGIVAGSAGSNGIKAFVVDFDDDEDPTGVAELLGLEETGVWYDLNGRKLNGQPSQKGIYIVNGKKVLK
ncbi:MAG: choice-of-anchor J domain-containing protein [Bacteroidaceae bacterium]|nr:choice-of-anchor J domain-containing protein [Bacteroidaceae bacterium]